MAPVIYADVPSIGISFDREIIEMPTMGGVEPDPRWKTVDANGHGHFYVDGKTPTLQDVVVGREWVGGDFGGEWVDVIEHRCRECGVAVEPGTRVVPAGVTSVPGPLRVGIEIDGERFVLHADEYAESVREWLESLRRIVQRTSSR